MSILPKRQSIAALQSSCSSKIPLSVAVPLLYHPAETVKATITVAHDSMRPTILQGSLVTIEQLNDVDQVKPGEIYYLVDHCLNATLARVTPHPNPDLLRVCCDNPNKQQWPNRLVPVHAIRAIFRVSASSITGPTGFLKSKQVL